MSDIAYSNAFALAENVNTNGNEIAIGSFMAISEKLELNATFDKQVIIKALDYLRKNQINYKIAVNLSMKTIVDKEFIKFLHDLVQEDKNVVKIIPKI